MHLPSSSRPVHFRSFPSSSPHSRLATYSSAAGTDADDDDPYRDRARFEWEDRLHARPTTTIGKAGSWLKSTLGVSRFVGGRAGGRRRGGEVGIDLRRREEGLRI
jgi:hypothetical protein